MIKQIVPALFVLLLAASVSPAIAQPKVPSHNAVLNAAGPGGGAPGGDCDPADPCLVAVQ